MDCSIAVLIKLRSSIDVIRDFIYYELIIIETITVKPLLQIAIHLQQMGKIGPFRKRRKVFWHIQNGPKGFLERKRTSF
jgi:hypothetical protein